MLFGGSEIWDRLDYLGSENLRSQIGLSLKFRVGQIICGQMYLCTQELTFDLKIFGGQKRTTVYLGSSIKSAWV